MPGAGGGAGHAQPPLRPVASPLPSHMVSVNSRGGQGRGYGGRGQREHDRGAKGWVLVASSGGGLLRFASQHVTLECYPKVGSIRERCGDRNGARDNEAVGSVAPDTSAMSHALRCSIALWKEAQAVGS